MTSQTGPIWTLARQGLEVTVARMPSGSDTADVLASGGAAAVRDSIKASVPAVHVIIDHHIDSWPSRGRGAEADLCCLRSAIRVLGDLRPPDAAVVAQRLSERLGIGAATVTHELVKGLVPNARCPSPTPREPVPEHRAARRLVRSSRSWQTGGPQLPPPAQ